MRKILLFFISIHSVFLSGQELFVVTDPASNVPADALSINIMQSLFKENTKDGYNYHFMPELSYGLNKNLMFRTSAFISNRNTTLVTEGASFFTKYRFYSVDDQNSHLRMAAYARYSFNNSDIHQEQIEILGHNSGYEVGMIATKLIKKLAISSSISYEKALDNNPDYKYPDNQASVATNYTLSFGRLMHPKKYTNYKQANINLMLEIVGQTINTKGKTFIDVVPAIQCIYNSQWRFDLAYRYQIVNTMVRSAPNGVYLNLYYTFFNVI